VSGLVAVDRRVGRRMRSGGRRLLPAASQSGSIALATFTLINTGLQGRN